MVLARHEFDSLALELTSRFCYKQINSSWHQQDGMPKPEVAAAWAKLKSLSISHDADPRLRKNTKWPRPLFALATKLQSLSLEIMYPAKGPRALNLLDYNGTLPFLKNIIPKGFGITDEVLLRFILRHASTLRSVDLTLRVTETGKSWEPLVLILRDNTPLLEHLTLRRANDPLMTKICLPSTGSAARICCQGRRT